MRRILVLLIVIALVIVSASIGVLVANWPPIGQTFKSPP